jgi:hypothetical protein
MTGLDDRFEQIDRQFDRLDRDTLVAAMIGLIATVLARGA